jgi:hypothetical protein
MQSNGPKAQVGVQRRAGLVASLRWLGGRDGGHRLPGRHSGRAGQHNNVEAGSVRERATRRRRHRRKRREPMMTCDGTSARHYSAVLGRGATTPYCTISTKWSSISEFWMSGMPDKSSSELRRFFHPSKNNLGVPHH